jgi:REP element-mobilizing transposase RayT
MPRPLRIQAPHVLYHVDACAISDLYAFRIGADYLIFLEILAETIERYEWICHYYCVMGTHVHLFVETPKANLALGMQFLLSKYSRRFNRRYGRKGHLFRSRYFTELVERDEHLVEMPRYLARNPVRAGIVDRPQDWPWSSDRAYRGLEWVPEFLTTKLILSQFDSDPDVAKQRYAEFVDQEWRPFRRAA